jgi:GntR family transcriptional regulator, phosphonate transport system regulatory protein
LSTASLWSAIAEHLVEEINAGHYRPGDKLPTEAELSARFGVNRHTVRHALAAMADRGLVHSRRGSGVFVAARQTDYPLGRRVRFHDNVIAAGQTPSRSITRMETRFADAEEARILRLKPAASVHVVEGVSLADHQPIAVFRSIFPAARFPGLLDEMAQRSSITAALATLGVQDFTRHETRLTAVLADPVVAVALKIQPRMAVLRSVSVNVDSAGQPVERGITWFAGDRVTLTIAGDQDGS